MVIGMASTVKITVTIPKDQLDEIRALVKKRRTDSVSAFVKHAIGISLNDAKEWRQMLDQWLMETGGPLTKEEIALADSVLDAPVPKPNTKKKRKAA
jgi:Arc/MetJ-type ribon-helix-helix transcriptional regulator